MQKISGQNVIGLSKSLTDASSAAGEGSREHTQSQYSEESSRHTKRKAKGASSRKHNDSLDRDTSGDADAEMSFLPKT